MRMSGMPQGHPLKVGMLPPLRVCLAAIKPFDRPAACIRRHSTTFRPHGLKNAHGLKIQRFVCGHEETLVFVPVKQIPKAPFRLVTLGFRGCADNQDLIQDPHR